MIELALLAAGWAAGIDLRRIALLGAAAVMPWLGLAAVALLHWRRGTRSEDRSVLFCQAVTSELRAGSDLRRAMAAAARSVGIETAAAIADSGGSLLEAATAIAGSLPAIGRELVATVGAAHRSGARVADLFDEVGALAVAEAEMAAEVRVASSAARATVLVLAAAPVAYLAFDGGALLGRAQLSGPVGLAGSAFFVSGLVVVVFLLQRSR